MEQVEEQPRLRMLTVGGGTGHFALLDGVKQIVNPNLITAVPHTVDDGGNSGELIAEFGVLPPGDARQCALALAPTARQRALAELFNFRFPASDNGGKLGGSKVGNLLIAALEQIHTSPETAMSSFTDIFDIPGRVIPVSNKRTRLVAHLTEGGPLIGEGNIDHRASQPGFDPDNRIKRVMLESELVVNPNVGRAIEGADLVIVAPGDLYTSKLPAFLVSGFVNAWHSTRALKVYCGDLMTKRGETDNMSAADCLEVFLSYLEEPDVDLLILNDECSLPQDVVKLYQEFGQNPMEAEQDRCQSLLPRARVAVRSLTRPVYPRVYNPKAPMVVLRHHSLALAQSILDEFRVIRHSQSSQNSQRASE